MKTTQAMRGVVGVIVVLVIAGLVMNWVGDYRSASKSATPAKETPSGETTKTEDSSTGDAESGGDAASGDAGSSDGAAEQPAATKVVLVVEVDGLNFRKEPNSDSPAMRGLKKGERVTLLEDQGDWYKVLDEKDITGYITSNPSYTSKVK